MHLTLTLELNVTFDVLIRLTFGDVLYVQSMFKHSCCQSVLLLKLIFSPVLLLLACFILLFAVWTNLGRGSVDEEVYKGRGGRRRGWWEELLVWLPHPYTPPPPGTEWDHGCHKNRRLWCLTAPDGRDLYITRPNLVLNASSRNVTDVKEWSTCGHVGSYVIFGTKRVCLIIVFLCVCVRVCARVCVGFPLIFFFFHIRLWQIDGWKFSW